ncbi:MAG: prephenate dehydratase [Pseudohongiellaceae bacterium]
MSPYSRSTRVAFLGPVGTYSHTAVLVYFGDSVTLLDCPTIDDVFHSVDSGAAQFGVVPVENSTEGAINNTLDCLVDTTLKIRGEVIVPVEHNLMYLDGTDPAKIIKIVSHKQSLAQCRKWLTANHAGVEQTEVASNAEAARIAAREKNVAAIAGSMAAGLYGLKIGASGIQDQKNNSTRFLILATRYPEPSGGDKTSTLIYAENRPGALFRILEPFERYQVSLTRIETRPSRKAMWDYVFFVDFEGHVDDQPVRHVLERLKDCTAEVKLLGSYPMAAK